MKKVRLLSLVTSVALMTVFFNRCGQPGKAETTEADSNDQAYDPKFAHPLDPLDSNEVRLVKQILVDKKIYTRDHNFSFIKLHEPSKAEVLAFQPGQVFGRKALASIYHMDSNVLTEIELDLKNKQVLAIDTMKGMQPVGLLGHKADSIVLNKIMKENTEWVAALKKRGIHIDSVIHGGNYAADMGMAPKGHREEIVAARYKNKKTRNLAVMGLYAYVDLTDKKILKIIDTGKGFTEPWEVNYFKEDSAKTITPDTKPIKIQQPEGVTYKVQGHEIIWNNWKFRYGVSNREGLIIYQAQFLDQGKWRSVLYRGSMPEMVVNYGSPDVLTASNNFFDVGEYRLGQSKARPMTPGADVPENATFFSTIIHNDTGKVMNFERAIALYEEFDGPLWRHNDKGHPATNLAMKYFTTIGNYDYAFKWVFKQDGTLDIVTELNGIVHIRGVERVNDLPGGPDETYNGSYYGTLVEEHVEAVNHQHFFVYRLDLDIDGTQNSVGEMNTIPVPVGKNNPYNNSMVTQMTYFKTEQEAQRSINAGSARHWKVMNHDVRDKWGHHSSYMLMPSAGIKPLVNEGASLLNRAGFLKNHVWITPLHEKEIYPAGEYPGSNLVNAGLPTWTAQNRNIDKQDVVLWYVAGVTHVVRPEEWPVMAPHYIKFSLMPYGFFSSNPTVKMPEKAPKIASTTATGNGIALDNSAECVVPAKGTN